MFLYFRFYFIFSYRLYFLDFIFKTAESQAPTNARPKNEKVKKEKKLKSIGKINLKFSLQILSRLCCQLIT